MTDRNMYRYSNIFLQEMRNLWLFICHLCQELYYSEGQTQTMSLLNHSQRKASFRHHFVAMTANAKGASVLNEKQSF